MICTLVDIMGDLAVILLEEFIFITFVPVLFYTLLKIRNAKRNWGVNKLMWTV